MAGNLLCSPDTMCRHIGLLFGERLDTLFTSSDSKISGFTRTHVIGFVADLFFSTLESGFIFSGFTVEFAGCVWTVAVSGKKKLRIRNYPNTCGRGLRLVKLKEKGTRKWPIVAHLCFAEQLTDLRRGST